MKFDLNQKIIASDAKPSNEIGKVSSATEYEALRAEKLFRYEYSNQLNTSLLTFAFTVFTAGLLIFTLLFEFGGILKTGEVESVGDSQIYIVFVEYFFACFFLLPCFFSKINFRYTVKNSLRIGQLTDYMRERVYFDDGESWESFKRDYGVNYFYKKPSGVGGAKDIPFWINTISCGLSIAVGAIGIYNLGTNTNIFLQENLKWHLLYGSSVCLFTFLAKILEPIIPMNKRLIGATALVVVEIVFGVGYTKVVESNCVEQMVIILVWFMLLICCIMSTPQYEKEIELANCVLEYTRAKLRYKKSNKMLHTDKERNELIFRSFLKESSAIKKYRKKAETTIMPNWYAMQCCKVMLSLLDIGCDGSNEVVSADSVHNYLVEIFMKRKEKE